MRGILGHSLTILESIPRFRSKNVIPFPASLPVWEQVMAEIGFQFCHLFDLQDKIRKSAGQSWIPQLSGARPSPVRDAFRIHPGRKGNFVPFLSRSSSGSRRRAFQKLPQLVPPRAGDIRWRFPEQGIPAIRRVPESALFPAFYGSVPILPRLEPPRGRLCNNKKMLFSLRKICCCIPIRHMAVSVSLCPVLFRINGTGIPTKDNNLRAQKRDQSRSPVPDVSVSFCFSALSRFVLFFPGILPHGIPQNPADLPIVLRLMGPGAVCAVLQPLSIPNKPGIGSRAGP